MRPGSPAPRPGRQATPPVRVIFGCWLKSTGVSSNTSSLDVALRPRDHQPPAERRDPLEHAGHVALGVVAISERLLLVAERQAAEEDQARRIVVLPQPARGTLASGLLDDRQLVALDLDVAEERLEALVRAWLWRSPCRARSFGNCSFRASAPAAAERRAAEQLAFPADLAARCSCFGVGQRLLPREAKPGEPVLVGGGRDRLPRFGLERRADLDAGMDPGRKLALRRASRRAARAPTSATHGGAAAQIRNIEATRRSLLPNSDSG